MKDDPKGMLTLGNQHLGPKFWTFSVPAFRTCPGSTFACLAVCYALGFLFYVRSTLDKHRRNWERSLLPEFARDVIREIGYKDVRRLRVHVAGDFFSVAYCGAWLRVMRACPDTVFLFYTRSWRVPELLPLLVEMAKLPNVFAFWSEDRDTGAAILPAGRRAFLCTEEGDEALVPPGVDLVFREDTREARKWVGGAWVCAKEQGTGAGVTCSACLRCVRPGAFPVPPEMRERGRDGSASLLQAPAVSSPVV